MKRIYRIGLIAGAAMILYFLLMKLIGQETNLFLRFFNFVILMVATYLLHRKLFIAGGEKPSYVQGLTRGVLMNITAVVVLVVFIAAYTKFIDPEFVGVLEQSKIWGNHLSITNASFAVFMEGSASAVILSFVSMQYFKRYTPGQVKT